MNVIWKYILGELPRTVVEMPVAPSFLHVGVQDNVPCVWVSVDPGAVRENRVFHHATTGNAFDSDDKRYLGTYQLNLSGGPFVGHVYVEDPA